MSQTIVAPYNVVPELDDDVACVIVEPVAANMGLVAPAPGFLEGLRAACDAAGALLVFDEVITGFRLGRGGAQERYGVRPDLTCFGKVIGGGLPIGAFGGRADVMAYAGAARARVPGRHPVGEPAGHRRRARRPRPARRPTPTTSWPPSRAASPPAGRAPSRRRGAGHRARSSARCVGLHFGADAGRRLRHGQDHRRGGLRRVLPRAARRGVALAPGAYEVAFPGLAHTDAVLDEIARRRTEPPTLRSRRRCDVAMYPGSAVRPSDWRLLRAPTFMPASDDMVSIGLTGTCAVPG